jgi:DNA modification methylase
MVKVFREIRRVLRDDGVVWLNVGDSYCATHQGKLGQKHSEAFHPTGWAYGENVAVRREKTIPDGMKPKDRMGIPHRLVFALQDDGWYFRDEIVWMKRNPMPESVTDRTTKAHEMVFLLTKRPDYFYDADAIRTEPKEDLGSTWEARKEAGHPMRYGHDADSQSQIPLGSHPNGSNARSVWDIDEEEYAQFLRWKAEHPNKGNASSVFDIPTVSYKGSHFATMPPKLAERCILAGTSAKGACVECGTPWEREIEKTSVTPKDYQGKNLATDKQSGARRMLANVRARREAGEPHDNPFPPKKTIGWRQACTCSSHAVRPCLVFDPFQGSGTTGSVATGLNRDYVGTDISDDYLTMARRRIERPHAAPLRIKAQTMPLFGE